MEKSFLDLVKQRYSVRGYIPKVVEESKIDYILECARMAPSAVNKQPWRFIVVKSDEAKEKLRLCYSRDWFNTAPMYIIACVDSSKAWVRSIDGKNHSDVDASIAIEHICLAAADQGLGSCWVCNYDVAKCKEYFNIKGEEYPVALIPIGYPAETDVKEKNRKEISEIVEIV